MSGGERHSYEPSAGHRLRHDPFNSIVAPRPIGWISTVGADGGLNLAPYSFFNAFCYVPPIVGFSSAGWKDSVRNASAAGSFVWNLATVALGERMNATSAAVEEGVDEFALAGLTPLASDLVAPPRVAESPVSFECRVTQVLRLCGADGHEADAWMTFGEVVKVHIDTALIVDGVFSTVLADPAMRGGGPSDYFRITEDTRFRMKRPG